MDCFVRARRDKFSGAGSISRLAELARQRPGMDEVFLVLFVHKKNALAFTSLPGKASAVILPAGILR
jgi:hypothetical protein